MIDKNEQKKIAVLIDSDNAQYSKLRQILQEISAHGHIITKRAYGDWSSSALKNWKDELNINAIQPVQQFAYTKGKNSTDSAMIIDAMDLLYTQKYDAFAIVSSDSDFTKLASRLRESQMFVFGIGEKKTPESFINACDDFLFLENLSHPSVDSQKTDSSKNKEMANNQDIKEFKILLNKSYEMYADDDGWANIAPTGQFIKRSNAAFDPRTYGYKKLPELIESFKEYEVTSFTGKNNVNIKAFRIKRNVEKNT